ncbi:MAG: type II toxin-antitoxin system RelE/ParE family toxin [Gammaproteobacteria bacterium]|nr:type II toxin-antitoxin system RelE/ParE family toxin [Gammaproteobacteria bacterium]
MIIIETHIFTRRMKELMSDEEYGELQEALVDCPDIGDIIQGSRGLRKVRWRLEGRGKSGGVRVIYYWMKKNEQIYMLYVYPKSRQGDLTSEQVKELKSIVERWSDEK